MTYKITETINTVGWQEGIDQAPPNLVTKAKQMAAEGLPATFGKVADSPNNWVVLGVNITNQLYIAARADS